MSLSLPAPLVEPVVAGLIGACSAEGAPTDEQFAILQAIVTHVWKRPELDVTTVAPLDPAQLAAAVAGDADRRRVHEMIVTLESCRHPLTDMHLSLIEQYESALGMSGPDAKLFRTVVGSGLEAAKADFSRFLTDNVAYRSEPSLDDLPVVADHAEPELVARLERLRECAPGTLGHGFLAFYDAAKLTLPGVEATPLNHFYVAHDMTHVISGIGATAVGEVAISAFLVAMNDDEVNRSALLASLIVHEAGFGDANHVKAESSVLARPGAAELLARELDRGGRCNADFSRIDHLAIADQPLAEIRAEFGVERPADPADGHHILW